jgi:hypothetical protein
MINLKKIYIPKSVNFISRALFKNLKNPVLCFEADIPPISFGPFDGPLPDYTIVLYNQSLDNFMHNRRNI